MFFGNAKINTIVGRKLESTVEQKEFCGIEEFEKSQEEERMSEESKCLGCTFLLIGFRQDRKGHLIRGTMCLCEELMAAGCIPDYEFSELEMKGRQIDPEDLPRILKLLQMNW